MRKAEYAVNVKEDNRAEAMLNEIDEFFIELKHKYPDLTVST